MPKLTIEQHLERIGENFEVLMPMVRDMSVDIEELNASVKTLKVISDQHTQTLLFHSGLLELLLKKNGVALV